MAALENLYTYHHVSRHDDMIVYSSSVGCILSVAYRYLLLSVGIHCYFVLSSVIVIVIVYLCFIIE